MSSKKIQFRNSNGHTLSARLELPDNIFKAARHPKSYISLDGADHLLSNSKDSQYAGKVIAGWADRYL